MISVLMPCYREPKEFFVAALESILSQTYKDIEVIVVMNGFNSELDDVLKEYAAKDSRLTYYINEKNMGLAYSLNRSLRLAKGEYIARMDSDDIAMPDRFEKELAYLLDNNLEFVCSYCETIDENGVSFGIMKSPIKTEAIYKELERYTCVAHPTWFLRRDVYERLGGYAELSCAEDAHFLLKAKKVGVKIGVLPECCLKYRVREGSDSHERIAEFRATGHFLRSHQDNIFDITPANLDAYLHSPEGKQIIFEYSRYFYLLGKFKKAKFGKLWYGAQLFMFQEGRRSLFWHLSRFLERRF